MSEITELGFDNFSNLLEAQRRLMEALEILPMPPSAQHHYEIAAALGICSEAGEVAQVVNVDTRPWATITSSKRRELLLKELVDVQLYVNEMLVLNLVSSDEFAQAYLDKVARVVERIRTRQREERDPHEPAAR